MGKWYDEDVSWEAESWIGGRCAERSFGSGEIAVICD